ncbi:MAG: hypothetical protein N4A49_06150, partial [Marinifilaceae bacterium]|nr:hypothetical protein [Marinifilaceae bacterium]
MKKLLLNIILIIASLTSWSQQYPVQVNLMMGAPYSVFLKDYSAVNSKKMNISILLRGSTTNSVNAKLRIKISGGGISMQTKASYHNPQIINLFPGKPEFLSGDMLADYLNPANMDFSGISREAFMKTGRLPEGSYKFTVEVYEARRN